MAPTSTRPGTFGAESQAQRRPPVRVGQGVAHQRAVLDELHLDLVAQAALVPLAGPGQVSDRQLQVVDPGEGGCV